MYDSGTEQQITPEYNVDTWSALALSTAQAYLIIMEKFNKKTKMFVQTIERALWLDQRQ